MWITRLLYVLSALSMVTCQNALMQPLLFESCPAGGVYANLYYKGLCELDHNLHLMLKELTSDPTPAPGTNF